MHSQDDTMPQERFKSITLPDGAYKRLRDSYETNRDALAVRGVRSLSGYVSYLFNGYTFENETADHSAVIRKVSFNDDRAVLMDASVNRIAEVVAENGNLRCRLCERDDCLHVGFAYSMREVNAALDAQAAGVVAQ